MFNGISILVLCILEQLRIHLNFTQPGHQPTQLQQRPDTLEDLHVCKSNLLKISLPRSCTVPYLDELQFNVLAQ